MKNLIITSIIFLNVVTILNGQNRMESEFFDYFKESFYLDEDYLRYGNGIGNILTDTVKNYMLRNKVVRFPKRCEPLNDYYIDLCNCLTGNDISPGFLLSDYYDSYDELTNEELYEEFISYLKYNINEFLIHDYGKINVKIFKMEEPETIHAYSRKTKEIISSSDVVKHTYVLLLTMYD